MEEAGNAGTGHEDNERAMALVTVVVGASRGLGRALAVELARRPQQRELVLAARDVAGLASLAAEAKDASGGAVVARVVQADVGRDEAGVAAVVEEVLRVLRANPEARWRVEVVYAAGVHEPGVVRDDAESADEGDAIRWRYSRAEDFPSRVRAEWKRVNVESAVALLSRLRTWLDESQRSQTELMFLYLSSQAADERWWSMGNSVYGPHKREAEGSLLSLQSSCARVMCVRYPFVATEMAHKLFEELLLVDPGLHRDPSDIHSPPLPREEVFLPLHSSTIDTAALITRTSTNTTHHFREIEPGIYSYEPPRTPSS